jgi:hypothetical protein
MGFLENLTKGFIRSAVNQVGRDGGKVISNKVYANGHSTPIRGIAQDGAHFDSLASTSEVVTREDLISSGYKADFLESGIFTYILVFIGSVLFPVLGPIYWLYLARKNFLKKNVKFYTVQQKQNYIRDRRFKTGVRPEGYTNVKTYSNLLIAPSRSEKNVFTFKGIIALIIAISIGYFHYSIIMNSESGANLLDSQNADFGVITAKNGLRLRQEPTETSKVLLTIPTNDTVRIIQAKADSSSIANWYKIEYKNQTGWGWSELIGKVEK